MSKTQKRPVRIGWVTTNEQQSNYTYKVLCWWLKKYGAHIVDKNDNPDCIMASFCSSNECKLLKRARQVADNKRVPLVLGGPESYTGAAYMAWADYLCIGEGWSLLRKIAEAGENWRDVLDSGENVLRADDPYRKVSPDYNVEWNLPIVQTAMHGWYALAGRGCHRKCKFCYTSWTQPYQSCSNKLIQRAQNKVAVKGGQNKLIFISNDAGIGKSAASTTPELFLANPNKKWPMVVRLGVEGLTESKRKWLGKPISDENVAKTALQAKRIGRQLQWFVIIGWPDDPMPEIAWQDMLTHFGCDASRAPRIYVKYSWFEPAPHTPLAYWDLHQLTPYNYEKAHQNLIAASGRFRRFKPGNIGKTIWSSCLRRLGPDNARDWSTYQNESRYWDRDTALAIASAKLGRDVVCGSVKAPWEQVETRVK